MTNVTVTRTPFKHDPTKETFTFSCNDMEHQVVVAETGAGFRESEIRLGLKPANFICSGIDGFFDASVSKCETFDECEVEMIKAIEEVLS